MKYKTNLYEKFIRELYYKWLKKERKRIYEYIVKRALPDLPNSTGEYKDSLVRTIERLFEELKELDKEIEKVENKL